MAGQPLQVDEDFFEESHLKLDQTLDLRILFLSLGHSAEVNGLKIRGCDLEVDISVFLHHVSEDILARVLVRFNFSNVAWVGVLGYHFRAEACEHLMNVKVAIAHVPVVLE